MDFTDDAPRRTIRHFGKVSCLAQPLASTRPKVRPNDTLINAPQFTWLWFRRRRMLMTMTALALVALTDPPARKEPPSKDELAAITDRGRDLAGYDAAAWHASDAVQAKQPKEGSVVRYIARKTDKRWVVAFGRLDEKQEKFLIAYEATQGDKPDVFDVKEMTPPKEDTGFFLSAARAIDTSLKDFVEHFEGEQRPYNVAVLPAEKGQTLGLPRPGTDQAGVWPLGGDVRYLISADGTKVVESDSFTRRSSRSNRRRTKTTSRWRACIRTFWMTPEDTDVFHVLTRKPTVPEMIITERFVFVVDVDGSIKYQGNVERS